MSSSTPPPDDLTAQFGTYHGLEDYDQVYFVQRDGRVTMPTDRPRGMPVIGDVYANAGSGQYITCFLPDMSDIEWQTAIGTGAGTIDLSPTAFLVSDCEQVYISGWGGETNATGGTGEVAGSTTFGLPTTDSPFQAGTDGSDFYLAVLSPNAEDLVYATLLRRTLLQRARRRRLLAIRPERHGLPGGLRGCGRHERFPRDAGRLERGQPQPNCNMGVFKFELGKLNAQIDIDGPDQFCQGESVQFENSTAGPAAFTWDFGDANFSNEVAPLHLYGLNGVFDVEVIAEDTTGCLEPDTAYVTVTIAPNADPQVPPVDALCLGESVQLDGSGNGELSWFPATGLSAADIPNPVAEPNSTITYTLTDVTLCGTESTDVTVEVVDMQTEINGDTQICFGDGAPLAVTSPQSEAAGWDYDWQPINWLSDPGAPDPVASPVETTTYSVTVTTPEGCERFHDVTVSVVPGALQEAASIPPSPLHRTVRPAPSRRRQHMGVVADDRPQQPRQPDPLRHAPGNHHLHGHHHQPLRRGHRRSHRRTHRPRSLRGARGDRCAPGAFRGLRFRRRGLSMGSRAPWSPTRLPPRRPWSPRPPRPSRPTSRTPTAAWPPPKWTSSSGRGPPSKPAPTSAKNGLSPPSSTAPWKAPHRFTLVEPSKTVVLRRLPHPGGLAAGGRRLHPARHRHQRMPVRRRGRSRIHLSRLRALRLHPDGDGLNDGWRPESQWLNGTGTYLQGLSDATLVPGYRLEIWDRWGQCIWATEDPRAYWTGGVGGPGTAAGTGGIGAGGHLVMPGVYTWVMHYPTSKGRERQTGKVTLVR